MSDQSRSLLRHDVRHGTRIARAEFVRSVREYLQDNRRIIGFLVAFLFLGGNLLFMLPAVYFAGRTAQSASTIPFFGPAASLVPVALVLFAALRTVERISGVEAEALMLTSVHPRAVVVGLLGAELARLALWFGVPVALVAGVFAAGLGAPGLLVTGVLVLLPLACCAAIWGYALGLGVLRLLRRLPRVRRVAQVGGILLFLVVLIGSQLVGQYLALADVSLESLLSVLTLGPVVEYVSLAFVGTPLARPVDATGFVVLLGLVALTPVGLVLAERQATTLWFTDDVVTRERSRSSPDTPRETTHFAPPKPFAGTQAGGVAWGILVRAVRKPQELVHLITIVFFAGPFVGTFTQAGPGSETSMILLAGLAVVLGAYLSGAAFGLNPLGDDRPQFPLLLLTETAPKTYVYGRIVAGLTVGLPVATLVPLVALTLRGLPQVAVAFTLAGVVACLAAALFAPGLGCLYPIYDAREIWGTESVSPSMLVMMAFTFVVIGGSSLGLVATWFLLFGGVGMSTTVAVALGCYLLLTGGLPLLSSWYALRRYRRFVFE
ncbi:hypothetical protein [Halogranum rubrum]|uniref:ABC-2 type transport system permease protein n=1 Tax=Halogranum salarium B-1 TaxID=1210908 RepID=J3JDY6_9EURY|nr:hypothetical protein [Halogranum salarium]EJN57896.1 hypothetical protein HSB1_33130 [Halogranum salarium B-1]